MSDDPGGTRVTRTTPGDIPAPPPWTAWTVGQRVVVRRRLPEGGWTDVLGDLVEVGPRGVTVQTRRGAVHVPAADIALGKPVPPAPVRRPAGGGPAGEDDAGAGAALA